MPDPIAFLTPLAGTWTGPGTNHDSQSFTARLTIAPPLNPTATVLSFTATGTTGEIYHTETILLTPDTAISASNNLPGLAHFLVTHPTPDTIILTLGDLANTTTFRETITLHLTPFGTLHQTYAWALPHTQLSPSSTATLTKTATP
jgi:hypothetical protein